MKTVWYMSKDGELIEANLLSIDGEYANIEADGIELRVGIEEIEE